MPMQQELYVMSNDISRGNCMVNKIIEPFMTRLDAMKDRQEESFYYDKRQICEMLNEAYFLGRKQERQEWEQAAAPKHRAAVP